MKIARIPLKDIKPGMKLIDTDGRITTTTGVTEETTPEELYELDLISSTGSRSTVRADGGHAWPLDPSAHGAVPPAYEGETEASTGTLARWNAEGWHPKLAPILVDGEIVHWTIITITVLDEKERANSKVMCVKVDSPTHSFMLAENTPIHTTGTDDKTGHTGTAQDKNTDTHEEESHTVQENTTTNTTQLTPVPVNVVEAARLSLEQEHEARKAGKRIRELNPKPFNLDDIADTGIDNLPGAIMVDPETFKTIAENGIPTHNCGGPLTLDTKLVTPNGTTTMGEVQVGDTLIGAEGLPVTVIGKSEIMEPSEILEFTLTDAITSIPAWTPEDILHAEQEYEATLPPTITPPEETYHNEEDEYHS